MTLRKIFAAVAAVGLVGTLTAHADTYYMHGDDASGKTSFSSSSNAGGGIGWGTEADGQAKTHTVSSSHDYIVPSGTSIRTPTSGTATTFAGHSLTLIGSLNIKRGGTFTINPLIAENGSIATANDKTTTTLAGGITIADGFSLKFNFGTSPTDGNDYRNLEVSSSISGAGDIVIRGSGVAKQTYLYLNGDMSNFTGSVTSDDTTEPPKFELQINNTFGGSIASIPSTTTDFKVKYDGLDPDCGLTVATGEIPTVLKKKLTFYSASTDFTAQNLPLMTFPAGTALSLSDFTIKYATTVSGTGTAFTSLGVKTTANGLMLVANPHADGTPVPAPVIVSPIPYWTGEVLTGVLPGDHYTLTGNTASLAGVYEAIATLDDGYCWADGCLDNERHISWVLLEFPDTDFHSTFLNELAAKPNRVHSSPYATGGDFIFTNDTDYIHVFFTTNGMQNFVANQSMMARVLAVGGGGAGGLCGGGGGAGGMLDQPAIAFVADAVNIVKVGSGGVWPKSYIDQDNKIKRDYPSSNKGHWATANNKRYSGESSYVSNVIDNVGTELVFVKGGGGGGSCGNKNGLNGGSGGGAYVGSTAGLGTDGQGHNGGRNAGSVSSAGGGGAGAAAEDCNTSGQASGGGAGKISDILGYDQYFAGGGSGGTEPQYGSSGAAGIGGGGRGATGYTNNNAQPGVDGLGGGGGGSGGQSGNVWAYLPGNGGNGIVVIRYTDPSQGSTVPQISLNSVTANNDATATVSWTLMASGSCDIYAVWGDAQDHLCLTNVIATTADSGSAALSGLLPGRTYHLGIFAKNGNDEESELTSVLSFTMPDDGTVPQNPPAEIPVISSVVIRDATGGDYVFLDVELSQAGTDSTFADCTATARWSTQNSYAMMTDTVSLPVLTDGTVTLQPTGLTMANYYACVEVVNAGGFVDRVYLTFCASDTSVYRWNPAVTEGAWRDPANWTSDTAKSWGLGYPLNDATADFTSTLCATVHVSGVTKVKAYGKEIANGEYVFIGDTANAEIYSSNQCNGKRSLQGGQRLVFDGVKANLAGGFMEPYVVGVGDTLILTNGSTVTCYRDGNPGTITCFQKSGADSHVEIYGGSTLVTDNYGSNYSGTGDVVVSARGRINQTGSSALNFGGGVSVRLDDGDIHSNPSICLSSLSSAVNPQFHISGAAPTIQSNSGSLYAQYTDAIINLAIPAEGWTANAVFRSSGNNKFAFDASAHNLVFNVPKTAPIRGAADKSAAESMIVSWAGGIDVTKIVFGTTAKSTDYFYFADADDNVYLTAQEALDSGNTITKLCYHHDLKRGFVVIVK